MKSTSLSFLDSRQDIRTSINTESSPLPEKLNKRQLRQFTKKTTVGIHNLTLSYKKCVGVTSPKLKEHNFRNSPLIVQSKHSQLTKFWDDDYARKAHGI